MITRFIKKDRTDIEKIVSFSFIKKVHDKKNRIYKILLMILSTSQKSRIAKNIKKCIKN
jgi:hypothetical protein